MAGLHPQNALKSVPKSLPYLWLPAAGYRPSVRKQQFGDVLVAKN